MNLLEQYKSAVIEAEQARQSLATAESRVRDLERKLGSPVAPPSSREAVPERLQYLMDMFAKAGGRMSLNEVAGKVKITRTGVWNQIKKLMDLGHMRQVDRGLYELTPD